MTKGELRLLPQLLFMLPVIFSDDIKTISYAVSQYSYSVMFMYDPSTPACVFMILPKSS